MEGTLESPFDRGIGTTGGKHRHDAALTDVGPAEGVIMQYLLQEFHVLHPGYAKPPQCGISR